MARAKQMQERRTAKKDAEKGDRTVASNRRARHDFEIVETLECGLVLQGSEVKSLRDGKAQITEAFARIENGEIWIYQMHIPPWSFAVGFGAHDPDRRRKLLAHNQEIAKWFEKTKLQPLTIVPTKVYFKDGRAKIEIALAKGRQKQDRRQAIKEREAKREMDRSMRRAEKFG
jgi:SsrA-binding protein